MPTYSFTLSSDDGVYFIQMASGLTRQEVGKHMDRLRNSFPKFEQLEASEGEGFVAWDPQTRIRWRWVAERF